MASYFCHKQWQQNIQKISMVLVTKLSMLHGFIAFVAKLGISAPFLKAKFVSFFTPNFGVLKTPILMQKIVIVIL